MRVPHAVSILDDKSCRGRISNAFINKSQAGDHGKRRSRDHRPFRSRMPGLHPARAGAGGPGQDHRVVAAVRPDGAEPVPSEYPRAGGALPVQETAGAEPRDRRAVPVLHPPLLGAAGTAGRLLLRLRYRRVHPLACGVREGASLLRQLLPLRGKHLLRKSDRDERAEPGPHHPRAGGGHGRRTLYEDLPPGVLRRLADPRREPEPPRLRGNHEVLRPPHLRRAAETPPEPDHLALRHDPQRGLSRPSHQVVPGPFRRARRCPRRSAHPEECGRPGSPAVRAF